jgi:hypothetical protein
VTFRLHVAANGRTRTPPNTERIRLAPGKRAAIDLKAINAPADGFVVVNATGPVVVDRESTGMPGITVSATVPDFDR